MFDGGTLSLPVGAAVMVWVVAALVAYQALFYACARVRQRRFRRRWVGRHALVTGGSKGLGLALARELAARGARVTIVARGAEALEEARREVEAAAAEGRGGEALALAGGPACLAVSADVTKGEELRAAVARAEGEMGPLFAVFPCAGQAWPGYFGAQSEADLRRAMEIDYWAVLATVRAAAPGMMDRGEGHIVVLSSGLALTAFIGYASYCPPKAAVSALGHVLRQELLPYGVRVYNAYPPTMDTPGLEAENRIKPPEALAIEAGEPVHAPRDCARAILSSVERGEYMISCGDLGVNLLVRASSGMMPRNNAVADALLLPLLAGVGKAYAWAWDREVARGRYEEGRRERLDALVGRRAV